VILVIRADAVCQYTKQGRALRAVADDHQAALSVGVSSLYLGSDMVHRRDRRAGCRDHVGGEIRRAVLACLIALKALPVLILGGFTSIPGAIVGGLIIGVGEKLFEFFFQPIIGGATENWFAYVLALVFLLFRPQGLFGEKIIERV
jgi:branched-chain amino acid transport system permease protein